MTVQSRPLELQVWGDTLDAIPIPTNEDIAFCTCENIAVNPVSIGAALRGRRGTRSDRGR